MTKKRQYIILLIMLVASLIWNVSSKPDYIKVVVPDNNESIYLIK